MRIFQNYGLYPAYKDELKSIRAGLTRFSDIQTALVQDRFGASHLLSPGLDGMPNAFLTAGDDVPLQRAWAREHGLRDDVSLEDILLAQIEEHRTEVFYNSDPMTYGSSFVRRLPGHVRATLAWRAAPSAGGDFEAYSTLLSNVMPMIEQYQARGMRVHYFSPAHDPVMDEYAARTDRPIDVAFVGGYSRHHLRRARIVEMIAALGSKYSIALHLNSARSTLLADSPLGIIGPLRKYRRPRAVRRVAHPPVFGRKLYAALGGAKIVINGAIDMAGIDRANMRCWEAMGSRTLMIGEAGRYPPQMEAGTNFVAFDRPEDIAPLVERYLADAHGRSAIADAGYAMISSRYSKQNQWADFCKIVETL